MDYTKTPGSGKVPDFIRQAQVQAQMDLPEPTPEEMAEAGKELARIEELEAVDRVYREACMEDRERSAAGRAELQLMDVSMLRDYAEHRHEYLSGYEAPPDLTKPFDVQMDRCLEDGYHINQKSDDIRVRETSEKNWASYQAMDAVYHQRSGQFDRDIDVHAPQRKPMSSRFAQADSIGIDTAQSGHNGPEY